MDNVPKEISSKPKSFPPSAGFKLIILITAVVAEPEFQVGLLLNLIQLLMFTCPAFVGLGARFKSASTPV